MWCLLPFFSYIISFETLCFFFQGIVVIDLDRSESIPSITAGGIGFPYVNFKLKSPRGTGLNYQLEVYN